MELLQDIRDYLENDYDREQESALLFCIKRAIKSFSNKRHYPDNYSDAMKEKDMDRFYMCIFDLTLYWVNKQGVEFQKSHSESGTSRSWDSEEDIFSLHNVIPIARIL